GKFISADTLVPDPAAPQAFNRYAYVLGNPLAYNDPTGHFPVALILLPIMAGIMVGVINQSHIADRNLEATPVSSTKRLPNVIAISTSASAGLGISTEVGGTTLYHVGSDTFASCINTCSEFTSEILGASGSISFAWTDARTARDVASGWTTSVSLGVGPISIEKWNTATELWHPPMATPLGTTGFTISSGVDVSPVNVTSSTCYCAVTSAGRFSKTNLPEIVQLWNKFHDIFME
ncbi:MAG TPA: hypothetical protein VK861_10290, partial [Bacteroidales bacterium]|nr:hypothetical protein [Bacteroidales bacterium]